MKTEVSRAVKTKRLDIGIVLQASGNPHGMFAVE